MIRLIFLAVVLLDQLSKVLILQKMTLGQSIPVVPPLFHLTLIGNTGIAFGLFKGNSEVWVGVGLLVLVWIYQLLRKGNVKSRWAFIGLPLIAGGALGNLIDRLRYGYVIDFLDFRVWPVFNVADICISVGTILFCIACLKK